MINSGKRLLDLTPRQDGHLEFVRLWTVASQRVHSYLLTMVLNRADAEDLLQEVGATAWEKFGEYDRSRSFTAWARGIARNKVLSFNQLASHRLVHSVELLEQIERVRENSHSLERQRDALLACLEKVGQAERRLLQVRYSDGVTLKGLADETGRSLQALYKALQRIHSRLFDCVMRRLASGRET